MGERVHCLWGGGGSRSSSSNSSSVSGSSSGSSAMQGAESVLCRHHLGTQCEWVGWLFAGKARCCICSRVRSTTQTGASVIYHNNIWEPRVSGWDGWRREGARLRSGSSGRHC